MLLATVFSRASSSRDSSLPVNTTTGRSRSASSACMRSSSSKPLMSGSRRSTTQQSNALAREHIERLRAGADRRDLDVVVLQQLDDAVPLDVVVLDHQQAFLVRRDVVLDAIERLLEILGRRRLDQIRERAVRQAVLPLLFDRQHLHRNVPRRRIELQAVQHRPAEHVRQEHVERDRRRRYCLASESAACPRLATMPLEALVAGQPEQHARVVRVVVDDQQRRCRPRAMSSRSSATTLLGLGDRQHGQRGRRRRERRRRIARRRRGDRARRPGVSDRQDRA